MVKHRMVAAIPFGRPSSSSCLPIQLEILESLLEFADCIASISQKAMYEIRLRINSLQHKLMLIEVAAASRRHCPQKRTTSKLT